MTVPYSDIAPSDTIQTGDTLVALASTGAWRRLSASEALYREFRMINVRHFGAVGNGTTNDTSAFQSAFAAAETLKAAIFVPEGNFLVTAGVLTIPENLKNSFRMVGMGAVHSRITATGTGSLLKFDGNATPSSTTRRQWASIERLHIIGPGNTVVGSVGLHINNAISCNVDEVRVTNFETNVFFDAHDLVNGAACYYNQTKNLMTQGGITNIRFGPQANSNKIFGGRATHAQIGVEIAPATTDVVLFGTNIESNTIVGAAVNGYGNMLLGCRFENPSATYEVHFNRAAGADLSHGAKNTVMSYMTSNDLDTRIRDDSTTLDNQIIWPGQIVIGSPRQSRKPMLKGYRYSDANLMAASELHDRYSSGGSPIGYQHTAARIGSIGFEASRSVSPFTTVRTYWRVMMNATNGKAEMWFGDYNAAAIDTNLYRDASDRLATDDAFRVGTVTTLPTAAVAYRGYMLRVEGGAGVTDRLYICEKNASDVYVWRQI